MTIAKSDSSISLSVLTMQSYTNQLFRQEIDLIELALTVISDKEFHGFIIPNENTI